MNKIEWKEVVKQISELKPFEHNPRNITEKGLKDLSTSIDKFGLAEPIVINTDNVIIGGHARYFALKQRGDETCQCYVPNRKLTEKQVKELNVRLNKNIAGTWDFDILANEFELDDLLDWGFEESDFGLEEEKEPKDLSDKFDETYEVVIECVNEKEQEKIYNQLTSEGYKCRILTL